MDQLECGAVTHKKRGAIDWGGYDGVMFPVPAEEPWSRRQPTALTKRRRARLGWGMACPDGHGDGAADPNRQLAETAEALLCVCKDDLDRRIVGLLADAAGDDNRQGTMAQEEIAVALDRSPSTINAHIKGIRERYTAYLARKSPLHRECAE